MSLTVIGEMTADLVLYRHGAEAGDIVYVSGPLGRAAAGLELFKRGMGGRDEFGDFYRAHLDPNARTDLGKILSSSGLVHAMMDLSDGLATDLAHICRQSNLGAVLYQRQLPFDAVLEEAAALIDMESLKLIIGGGEDYELLLTVPPHATKKLQEVVALSGYLLYPVGRMTTGVGITLVQSDSQNNAQEIPIEFLGFDHFNMR